MTDKPKNPKWNDELSTRAVDAYKASDKSREAVEAIGVELGGFNFKQMVGKLSSLKVYETPVKEASKPRDMGPTKDEILNAIEAQAEFDVEGFNGATKDALKRLAITLDVELPEVSARFAE